MTKSRFQAVDTSRFTRSRTQKREFLLGDEGALPPATPVNPYLGGSARKKWSIFSKSSTFSICPKLHFWAKNTSRGSPEVLGVPGGSPCRTDMDCIEGVKVGKPKIEKRPNLAQNRSKRHFDPENHRSSQSDISDLTHLTLSIRKGPQK